MEQVMLDMIPTGAKAVCHVSQYDIGRTIRFNLISGGAAYTLSGTETVKVYIKKPDGTTAERNIANTSSTYVDWVTGEGDCDQAGNCECELVITSGTTVIGSKNFTVKIEEDPYNDQEVVTETAGPAVIATFTTNVVDLLQEVKCSINPIQNGTPWIDSNEINKEPYIKRAVAGTATRIGNHLYDKLVGGTVAFNQMVQNGNFADASDWMPYNANNISISVANNILTATALNAGGGYNFGVRQYSSTTFKDHIYFVLIDCKPEIAGEYGIDFDGSYKGNSWQLSANEWNKIRLLTKANGRNNPSIVLEPQAQNIQTVGSTIQWKNVNIIDLTLMLGSSIADYIYSLEQATASAGVAFFRNLFPNDYYAYNAGELMSVKATAHVMKNASNTVIGNYPLDSNLELRGIPKLVNNKLEYDGDTYESNGKVTRKFIKLIFNGSENWQIYEGDGINQLYVYIDNIKTSAQGITTICAKYRPISINDRAGNYNTCYTGSGSVSFNVEGYTVETWKAFLSNNNIEIVCELVTPTTESASPFTNPQVCDENGTEEYTDSRAVAIPVGHETYQANICEITGFDELNIQQAGVNLYDNIYAHYRRPVNYLIKDIPLEIGKTYTLKATLKSGGVSVTGCYVGVASKGEQYSEFSSMTPCIKVDGTTMTQTFTPTNTWTSPKLIIYDGGNVNLFNSLFENYEIQLTQGSTPTEYKPYTSKLIKLEFDDTVYLAEVSCLNGVWKLKLLGAEVELGDLTWMYNSTLKRFYARFDDGKASGNAVGLPALCDIYPVDDTNQYNNLPDGSISVGSNYISGTVCAIVVHDERYSSDGTFKTAIAGYKVICELATPIEITLDETEQFEALLGVNNVWHDGNGNTEVKYLYNA